MNILIVEDDNNKAAQIAAFVSSLLPNAHLEERHSYHSGLKAVVNGVPSLMILDMTMPTYDVTPGSPGGRMRPYAGRDILRECERRSINTKIVVVTQFESFFDRGEHISLKQLSAELDKEFPRLYVGTVYYHPSESVWKDSLKQAIIGAIGGIS